MRGRQVACTAASCQAERHRRACARWRETERAVLRRDSLMSAVSAVVEAETTADARADATVLPRAMPTVAPTSVSRVRDAVPEEVAVLIGVFAKVLLQASRDAVVSEVAKVIGKSAKESHRAVKDVLGSRHP
jgi:hypothetical protein